MYMLKEAEWTYHILCGLVRAEPQIEIYLLSTSEHDRTHHEACIPFNKVGIHHRPVVRLLEKLTESDV